MAKLFLCTSLYAALLLFCIQCRVDALSGRRAPPTSPPVRMMGSKWNRFTILTAQSEHLPPFVSTEVQATEMRGELPKEVPNIVGQGKSDKKLKADSIAGYAERIEDDTVDLTVSVDDKRVVVEDLPVAVDRREVSTYKNKYVLALSAIIPSIVSTVVYTGIDGRNARDKQRKEDKLEWQKYREEWHKQREEDKLEWLKQREEDKMEWLKQREEDKKERLKQREEDKWKENHIRERSKKKWKRQNFGQT